MIYLDNAATTFPKPDAVCREVLRCLSQYCGNPGRGAHPLALRCAEKIYATRELLADFLGLGAPERIVFVSGATHGINLVLKGFLRPGDHVLISELEHNAVRRPLYRLCTERGVQFDVFPVVGKNEQEILQGIEKGITYATKAVICTHASNVCSLTLPLERIGRICRKKGLKLIVDAAQSAGHLPIDMREMQIDALIAPAHKALYGIQGAGVLALGKQMEISPLLEGGSGSDSLSPDMPDMPPERFEAGTLPTPAIVALGEGVRFLRTHGLAQIAAHERALFCAARERLESLPDITVYQREAQGAVLLFQHAALSPQEVAHRLARDGICVRAGLHCAPMAHTALGTPPDGAVRVSFGFFNTLADADALWKALKA